MSAVVLILAILGMGFLAFLWLGVASSIVLLTWDEREVGPRRVCRDDVASSASTGGRAERVEGCRPPTDEEIAERPPRDRRETAAHAAAGDLRGQVIPFLAARRGRAWSLRGNQAMAITIRISPRREFSHTFARASPDRWNAHERVSSSSKSEPTTAGDWP